MMTRRQLDATAVLVAALPAGDWRPVVGFEDDYWVSAAGRVFSRPRPRTRGGVMPVRLDDDGYPRVNLVHKGVQTGRRVHLLVAAAFLGPRPSGLSIRHLDGDASNNAVDNLRYGTHAENMRDMVLHGRSAGAKTSCSRGHPFDEVNTGRNSGRRYCRQCRLDREKSVRR